MPTRPMLASKVKDINEIRFPVFATPKIDGIRCLKLNGLALTRTFKEVPNRYVNQTVRQLPEGLDGELVLKDGNFNDTQSAIMSYDGLPDFEYLIFDYAPEGTEALPFVQRWAMLQGATFNLPDFARILVQQEVWSIETLMEVEEACLAQGFEGVCTRRPDGFYKSGRSTPKEQYLLKLKRFSEAEAEVIGFVELQHNLNEAEANEFGLTKRSKQLSGLVGGKVLGALVVRDLHSHVEFEIGTGFTASDRINYWTDRDQLLGQVVTYKFQPHGMKDKPRCPVFRGFRFDV